jgi:steroid delta-isomerase-like uncharacterized protein
MTAAATAVDLGREGVEAFNAGDWDRFRDTMAPDAVYQEPATQRRAQGLDEILAINQGWKEAFPDAHGTITSATGSGDEGTIEVTWQGTHTGTLASPMGDIPPTQRQVTVEAVQVIQAADGRVVSEHHYFDALRMMQQLGLLPASAAAQR